MPPEPPALDLDDLARRLADRLLPLLRPGEKCLIDRPELARRLDVAERTVSALVARGELPPALLHTAGIARWDWAEVLKCLAARRGRKPRRGRGRYERDRARPGRPPRRGIGGGDGE
jgi:hypothetical protein